MAVQHNGRPNDHAQSTYQAPRGTAPDYAEPVDARYVTRKAPLPVSVLDFNLDYGRAYSTSNVSEKVAALNDFFNKDIQGNNTFKDVASTVVLDGRTLGLTYSCIALVLSGADQEGMFHTPVHVMIVAGSAPAPIPVDQTLDGRQTQIRRVPGDMSAGKSGDVLWTRVDSVVRVSLGDKPDRDDPTNKVIVYEAGQSVIPEELTEFAAGVMSKQDEARCRRILSTAFEAVVGIRNEVFDSAPPITAAALASAGTVVARIDPEPATVYTAAGLPVRADISLEVSLVDTQAQQGMERTSTVLSEVAGFLEPRYVEPDIMTLPNGQPVTQRFSPNLILTNFYIDGRISLESIFFALFSARLLAPNYQWAQALKPKFNNAKNLINGINIADIGAIGIDLPMCISEKQPITLKTGDDASFFQLVQAAFHNELVYSIDVEETGESSWALQTLVEHAAGDYDATDRIIKALNNLTGGVFGSLWPDGAPMFTRDDNQILLGYFTDSQGNRRDIREAGYLAMLNIYGKSDYNTVVEFDNTFDANRNMDIRQDVRCGIIQNTLGSSVFYTGRANRISATPELMECIGVSLQRAGLTINPAGVVTMSGGNVRRNASQFTGRGVSGTTSATGFSSGPGRSQATGGNSARSGYGTRRTFG